MSLGVERFALPALELVVVAHPLHEHQPEVDPDGGERQHEVEQVPEESLPLLGVDVREDQTHVLTPALALSPLTLDCRGAAGLSTAAAPSAAATPHRRGVALATAARRGTTTPPPAAPGVDRLPDATLRADLGALRDDVATLDTVHLTLARLP